MEAANRSDLSVLIVDDDVAVANALGRLLRANGHTVHLAYTAVEGLALANSVKPDLILHDLAMPGLGGHEAAGHLRRMPSLSEVVLIACSGSVDEVKAREAGFDGWLVKPISDGDLEAVLAMVLQRIERRSSNGAIKAPRRVPE